MHGSRCHSPTPGFRGYPVAELDDTHPVFDRKRAEIADETVVGSGDREVGRLALLPCRTRPFYEPPSIFEGVRQVDCHPTDSVRVLHRLMKELGIGGAPRAEGHVAIGDGREHRIRLRPAGRTTLQATDAERVAARPARSLRNAHRPIRPADPMRTAATAKVK